jgi:hypothetical protein
VSSSAADRGGSPALATCLRGPPAALGHQPSAALLGGRALLERLGGGAGLRALDVGCDCFGWLRLLSTWVGAERLGERAPLTLLAVDGQRAAVLLDDLPSPRQP